MFTILPRFSVDLNPSRFLRNINIHKRLVTFFILFSLIPLFITAAFSYKKSKEAIRTKISTYSVQVMNQIARNMRIEITRIEYDSIDIVFSEIVQETLKNYNKLTKGEKFYAEKNMGDLIVKKFSFLHDISDVIIYTNDGQRINAYGDDNIKFKLKPQYLQKLLTDASNNKGIPVWVVEGEENVEQSYKATPYSNETQNGGILLARSFKTLDEGVQLGIILIRINERYFNNIYQNVDIGTDADIFVINSEGLIISSRNPENKIAHPFSDENLIELLRKNRSEGKNVFNSDMDGKHYLVAYSPIEMPDWYIVSLIPYSYLNAESSKIGTYTLILGIICIVMAVIFSFIISRSISVPLNKLIKYMKSAEDGDLTVNIRDDSKDEIAKVTSSFNNMVAEIRKLMDNIKEKERQKRTAELKTLQAQITPHFLSNTLNIVKRLADVQEAYNISGLVSSLIQLLNICMGKGEEIVTLRDEIEYVKNYINIQEYRYYDKFKIFFDLEDSIMECLIIRFTLQPIIENSIIHGIEPMNGQGVIVIKGYADGEKIRLSITDNGVGIPQDRLEKILSGDYEGSRIRFNSIGIKNVDERIKMYFGDEYGLSVQSEEGLFTSVGITIPLIRNGGAISAESANCR